MTSISNKTAFGKGKPAFPAGSFARSLRHFDAAPTRSMNPDPKQPGSGTGRGNLFPAAAFARSAPGKSHSPALLFTLRLARRLALFMALRLTLYLALSSAILLAFWPAAASAQGRAQQDNLGNAALDAVTQPMADLNLRSKDIPLILRIAEAAPYDLEALPDCKAVIGEIARLDEVLGPDADSAPDEAGLLRKGLNQGGKMLGGLIPFRGIVRQISGANAQAKKWEAAINAGFARRSFLKGYLAGKHCTAASDAGTDDARGSARKLLGLAGEEEDEDSEASE